MTETSEYNEGYDVAVDNIIDDLEAQLPDGVELVGWLAAIEFVKNNYQA